MFKEQQIKKIEKLLGLKDKDNVILFGSRLSGWIQQNGTTTTAILRGISIILEDLHKKENIPQKEVEINLSNVKNPILFKYAKEILKLHKEDKFGARKIERWLKEMHNAKISYVTIHKFLKQQKELQKEVKNG